MRRRGLKPVVDLHITCRSHRNARGLESDSLCVRRFSERNEQVRSLDRLPGHAADRAVQRHCPTRPARDALDIGIRDERNPFSAEHRCHGCCDVGVLAHQQPLSLLTDRDSRSKAGHRLGELERDVAAAQDEQVFRQGVEVEKFDMGHSRRRLEPREVRLRGEGAEVEEHPVGAHHARPTLIQRHFDGTFTDELAAAHYQFGAACLEPSLVHRNQAVNHGALARLHFGH
jgi:hypothetical protein